VEFAHEEDVGRRLRVHRRQVAQHLEHGCATARLGRLALRLHLLRTHARGAGRLQRLLLGKNLHVERVQQRRGGRRRLQLVQTGRIREGICAWQSRISAADAKL